MSGIRPLICVFAGAHTPRDGRILEAARELGKTIGEEGYDILYGGGSRGVMGEVTNAAHEAGAQVKAVLLNRFAGDKEATPAEILAVVDTEYQRFPIFMEAQPVAFVGLPGGTGTMREITQGVEEAAYNEGPPVILVKVGRYNSGIKEDFNRNIQAGLIDESHKEVLKEWRRGQSIRKLLAKTPKNDFVA